MEKIDEVLSEDNGTVETPRRTSIVRNTLGNHRQSEISHRNSEEIRFTETAGDVQEI